MSQSWHFCDIARLRMGFRFRWKSGRAADITLTTECGPKRSSGAFTRFAYRPHRPRDGSVVSSLRCMNDPQPEGHMASHIERRKFLATLGGAAAAWPLGVLAQVSTKRPLVGLVHGQSPTSASPVVTAFVQRMQELGYVAGSDVDIAYRNADGVLARGPALADEMVSLKPDVVVTTNTQLAIAIKQATSSIPIVAANITDPVAFGLVARHARPGGNVTGILATLDT